MAPLPTFQLPLIPGGPPDGFGWEQREFSDLSRTTAFIAGINERDKFLGRNRCVICGIRTSLELCYIIPKSEPETWIGLKRRDWLPEETKERPEHEPRGGLLMCRNHNCSFDEYHFFIRFLPDVRRFVFINHSGDEDFQEFHGKAIALDNRDRYAPFPSLFIIHEMRVRGRHPFRPSGIDLPDDIPWQQWISADGVYNDVSDSFNRRAPPGSRSGDTPPGRRRITMNADVIAEILAATRASPSWKACEMEGMGWDGTAEENIQKYVSSIGVQDSQESEPEDPRDD